MQGLGVNTLKATTCRGSINRTGVDCPNGKGMEK